MSLIRETSGVAKALWRSHSNADGQVWQHLLADFVNPGDLVFDIGANVGAFTSSARSLGARVVAIEPQTWLAFLLRSRFFGDKHVNVVQRALGHARGAQQMYVNLDNPTVSSLSASFVKAAGDSALWRGQCWEKTASVLVIPLDDLIEAHGEPRFCKIDVEGFEAEVLQGLSAPLEALSFEFTTIQRDAALNSIRECERLANYRYNAVIGAGRSMQHERWLDAESMRRWLRSVPESANSGDVYALRESASILRRINGGSTP